MNSLPPDHSTTEMGDHDGARPVALELKGAHRSYDGTAALVDVSLRVEPGECLALVGESGSGKSTLLRTFNAMVRLDRGTVLVDGQAIDAWDPVLLRRRTGYVPQEGGLMPHWTVLRNVALVPTLLGESRALEEARSMLELVGLPAVDFGGRWPRSLSGGERQRVAIARALAARPGVVLLDEPFGALDAITRADLQAEFLRLRQQLGFTALLVTHDVREAMRLGDRVAIMRSGRIDLTVPPAELMSGEATPYARALLEKSGVLDR